PLGVGLVPPYSLRRVPLNSPLTMKSRVFNSGDGGVAGVRVSLFADSASVHPSVVLVETGSADGTGTGPSGGAGSACTSAAGFAAASPAAPSTVAPVTIAAASAAAPTARRRDRRAVTEIDVLVIATSICSPWSPSAATCRDELRHRRNRRWGAPASD